MEGERPYADLASEIRHFVGRVAGPSLDLLGTSLEVMCYEGLAEMDGPAEGVARLHLTDLGRAQFRTLMTSGVRAPVNDVSKLVIALKMRFLHRLDRDDRLLHLAHAKHAQDRIGGRTEQEDERPPGPRECLHWPRDDARDSFRVRQGDALGDEFPDDQ